MKSGVQKPLRSILSLHISKIKEPERLEKLALIHIL